jgi:hypothetical protein
MYSRDSERHNGVWDKSLCIYNQEFLEPHEHKKNGEEISYIGVPYLTVFFVIYSK